MVEVVAKIVQTVQTVMVALVVVAATTTLWDWAITFPALSL